MFEEFGFETLTAAQASLYFALGLGLLFGVFSEQVKFCFRRALIGADRAQAAGVWAMALLVAVLGTQYFVTTEVIGLTITVSWAISRLSKLCWAVLPLARAWY